MTMPLSGARKVSVRVALPLRCRRASWSAEMSQFLSRASAASTMALASYEPRAVKLGARAGGYAAVLDGVREGEKVVTGANFLIDAESNLRAALQAFTAPEGKSP